MVTPPFCGCHGEPQRWRNDKRKSAGGYWACSVKLQERVRRYNHSDAGRATQARHNKTAKGRARYARHKRTDKFAASNESWLNTPKGRAYLRRKNLRKTVKRRELRILKREELIEHRKI